MKTFAKVAVAGVAGLTFLKLFTTVLIPMLGMMLGLIALTVKLAVIAAVIFFLWSLVRPPREETEPSKTEMDEKIEIVVEDVSGEDGE
jgi:hypothetical protein